MIDLDDPEIDFVDINSGFHSRSIVANMAGSRNPRYCLFGFTANAVYLTESNSKAWLFVCS